jgi:GNAT superfamily N-acetyltransferase
MIREVTRRDAGRVLELLGELWPDSAIDVTAREEVLEHYLAEPNYWCLGCEEGDDLRGLITVSFRWSLFHAGEVAVIEDLVVEGGHRGRGMGKRLVAFVEESIAGQDRAKAIEVNSDLHREAAQTFWERCGHSRLAFQYRKLVPRGF